MLAIFIILYFVMVGLFMYANYFDLVVMRSIMKAVCGIMFVFSPILLCKNNKKVKDTKYFKTMMSGFILAALGDVLLDLDNSSFGILFIVGMLFFALTHVMFSISFLKHVKFNKTTVVSLISILIPTLLLLNCFNLINARKKLLNRVVNIQVVSPIGFEPMTVRLEGVCSIQLSYEDINSRNKLII